MHVCINRILAVRIILGKTEDQLKCYYTLLIINLLLPKLVIFSGYNEIIMVFNKASFILSLTLNLQ